MNTVSSGKSICLFLLRSRCKHTEHETSFKLQYIVWEQKHTYYYVSLYTDNWVSLLLREKLCTLQKETIVKDRDTLREIYYHYESNETKQLEYDQTIVSFSENQCWEM